MTVLVGFLCFRNVDSMFAHMRGDALTVEQSTKSFGDLYTGDDGFVTFNVHNVSSSPIKILGLRTSCGCIVSDELPLTVQSDSTYPLHVKVRQTSQERVVDESLELFTNHSSQKTLSLRVTGRILPRPSSMR
jgi:hypothetical protein